MIDMFPNGIRDQNPNSLWKRNTQRPSVQISKNPWKGNLTTRKKHKKNQRTSKRLGDTKNLMVF